MVLEDAPQKLTCGDNLAEWPTDFDRPGTTQLKLWLARAVERGVILREGTGRKRDPYRYWLAARIPEPISTSSSATISARRTRVPGLTLWSEQPLRY
jgi:hypothetical protein